MPERKLEIVKREPLEMKQMYEQLLAFLFTHPEYQWIETETGFHIVISPVKLQEKSAIETLPKQPIIGKK